MTSNFVLVFFLCRLSWSGVETSIMLCLIHTETTLLANHFRIGELYLQLTVLHILLFNEFSNI